MVAPLNKKMEDNDPNLFFFEKLIQEKLTPLSHELVEVKGTLRLYKQKNLEQENNIEALKKEQAALQREIVQIKANDLEKTHEIIFLKQSIKNLEAENKRLNEEKQKKENAPLNFEAENLQLRNNNNDLQVKNMKLQDEKDDFQIEKDANTQDKKKNGIKNVKAEDAANKESRDNLLADIKNNNWRLKSVGQIPKQEKKDEPVNIIGSLVFNKMVEKARVHRIMERKMSDWDDDITQYQNPDQINIYKENDDIPHGQGSNKSMIIERSRERRKKKRVEQQNKNNAESAVDEKEIKNEKPK